MGDEHQSTAAICKLGIKSAVFSKFIVEIDLVLAQTLQDPKVILIWMEKEIQWLLY